MEIFGEKPVSLMDGLFGRWMTSTEHEEIMRDIRDAPTVLGRLRARLRLYEFWPRRARPGAARNG